MTSVFDIIHLSDLHIASKSDRVSPLDYFRADKKRILYQDNEPYQFEVHKAPTSYDKDTLRILSTVLEDDDFHLVDIIIITGDLATTGMEEDIIPAYELIGGNIDTYESQILERLIPAHIPLAILPGNHDRYKGNTGKPHSKLFNKYFKNKQNVVNWPYWKGEHDGRFHYNILKDRENTLLLVSMDLSLENKKDSKSPQKVYRYGQGRVSSKLAIKIIEYTADLKKKYNTNAVVWCTHFPPNLRGFTNEFLKLLGDKFLIDCANKSGVKHILCGHTHKRDQYQCDDINIHVVGSACGAEKQFHDFQRLSVTLENNEIVDLKKRYYETNKDNFWFEENTHS